jgi:hypothetical protein
MHARSLLLRRLAQRAVVARPYHASLVSCDALDMVDTFARRHSTFSLLYTIVIFSYFGNV